MPYVCKSESRTAKDRFKVVTKFWRSRPKHQTVFVMRMPDGLMKSGIVNGEGVEHVADRLRKELGGLDLPWHKGAQEEFDRSERLSQIVNKDGTVSHIRYAKYLRKQIRRWIDSKEREPRLAREILYLADSQIDRDEITGVVTWRDRPISSAQDWDEVIRVANKGE